MTSELSSRRCVPCEKGTPPLPEERVNQLLGQVPGWELRDGKMLRRRFRFDGFRESMNFVNRVADLAEEEGHHPDFYVSYNRVRVDLTTHAIGGLSENDFIMAAKIDDMVRG
jgi:4a-hydroxytetrahydrobiopterin dehydratase